MLALTTKLISLELHSAPYYKCIPAVWNRFINTISVQEGFPLVDDASQQVPYEEVFREKEVEIQTCGNLYEKWRKEKRFWTVPKSDLTFKVKYIDTGDNTEIVKPTIVSLHGSPGSYKEFTPITKYLSRKGVRVIAPNFPGIDNLQPSKFRHIPEEKSQFIRDFLRALRVCRVDLVLCHSSALFPGLQLSLGNEGISVNSLALVNPTGLEIPRLLKPVWLFNSLIRISEFPMGYKVTRPIVKRLTERPELKGGSFEEHYFSALTLLHSAIPKQKIPFQTLLDQNFPMLLAFSHNDKLISKSTSYKMAEMMVNLKDVVVYDKDGTPHGSGGLNSFRKVMAFEKGSHFLLRTYPDAMCEVISSFLFQQFDNKVKME